MIKRVLPIVALVAVMLAVIPGSMSDALSQNGMRPEQQILQVPPPQPIVRQPAMKRYEALRVSPLDQNGARGILWNLQQYSSFAPGFEKVENIDGRYLFSSPHDPSAVFDIDARTGSFLLNYGLKRYSGEGSTKNLPSAAQAKELAWSYLGRTGYLPKNEEEMVLAGIGGLDLAVAKDGKTGGPYKKLVTVRFSRVLDGIPVQGPGSRIVVHLGQNGVMNAMIRNWLEVKAFSVRQKQQKSSKVIRRDIAERLSRIAGGAKEILDQNAVQVLYDDGLGIIEPAIYVTAVARYEGPGEKGVVDIPVDFYVPVLKSSKADFPFKKDRGIKSPGRDRRQTIRKEIRPMQTGGDGRSDMR
ncbi:MAG: hypothetical protein C1942_01180 [Prosthecochloris sp.]|uniref:hypothetical protein n=1 Tax=Prosthecochloris sp. TaxID=290513 RepID=UPI0013CB7D12|nr:hypothetical protein [Prosthecochloris sp.]NEX11309.1 hypothetical protein [Prosthecochloris sp.]